MKLWLIGLLLLGGCQERAPQATIPDQYNSEVPPPKPTKTQPKDLVPDYHTQKELQDVQRKLNDLQKKITK